MGRKANYPMQPATAAAANLRNVSPYHPLVADTFGDWAVEAGDKVTLTKDGASYTSPVHETTLTWNGQPKLEIVSNGNEERAPIEKMATKKYNSRGSTSGIRDSSKLYTFEVNQRHLLYDVYNEEYGRLHACIEITSSAIRALLEDLYNGLFGYLEMTASHLLVQFWGIYDGLSSQLELTRSALTVQFVGLYDGLRSDLELTRSRLKLEFDDAYNGLYSGLEMTASRLRIWFTGLYDGLNSELEMTRSRLYVHFWGLYDGLSGELEMTRSRFWLGFNGLYDGLHGELEMTRSRFGLAFDGLYDGLHGELEMTRSRFAVAFDGLYDGLHGELEMTRSRFHVEFMGLYDGLRGELDLTRSRFGVAFDGLYDGLHGEMEMTRSRFALQFDGLYDGLHGEMEMTRSRLYAGFMGLYDGLRGDLSMTRSQLLVQFSGMYDGLDSRLEVTRSQFSMQISNYYSGLSSRVEQTASAWSAIVDSNGDIKPAKIQASINKATGTSKILLSADNVEIDGDLVTGALDGEDVVCDSVETGGLSVGGECTFDINAPIVGGDGGTNDYNWGDVIVNAELLTDNKTLRLTRLDGSTVDFSKATTLSPSWSSGSFPLTVNATQTNNGVTTNVGAKTIGFTNAADVYLTVEKNGDPTAFGNSQKLINVPFKIVHHAGGTVGDQDRYASSLASVDATSVYNNGYDQARTYSNAPTTGDTSSASMSVKTPKADRTGYDTTTYTVSVDSSYAYIKTNVNGTNVTIARTANTASTPVYYLQESWGTGNDSNKLLIGRTTSGNTTSFTHTITADATLSYNSTTHKYTATGKAKVDGSEKDSDTDTESTAQGYLDGWDDCYDTLDTTGTTATKTLSAGEQAVVSVKQKNKDGSVITRLSRTYTAPNVTESDISIQSGYFGAYSATALENHNRKLSNNTNADITLSHATGYYTLVIGYPGSAAGKWYQIYIDGSALASSSITSVTAGTSAISWDSTNKKFYNYGYAYVNGGSQPEATSTKRESSVVSLDTSASWSNGSKSIVVKHGSTNILSDSVSIPASSATAWENPSGHQWRARLTIGGAYRYSDNHEFYTLSEYNAALSTVPSGYTAKSATTITNGNINAASIAVYSGHYACNMSLTLNFGDGTTRSADVSGGVIVDDIVAYGQALGGGCNHSSMGKWYYTRYQLPSGLWHHQLVLEQSGASVGGMSPSSSYTIYR